MKRQECADCKSTNVLCDAATVKWDETANNWSVIDFWGGWWCCCCETEVDVFDYQPPKIPLHTTLYLTYDDGGGWDVQIVQKIKDGKWRSWSDFIEVPDPYLEHFELLRLVRGNEFFRKAFGNELLIDYIEIDRKGADDNESWYYDDGVFVERDV